MFPSCSECVRAYRSSYLGKGVEIIITRNLLVSSNITNGSCATISELYFEKDSDSLPAFVTLKFSTAFSGITLDDGTVPVSYIEEKSFCQHFMRPYVVKYYPFLNSFGITIFRAQGKTLPSAFLCFDGFKFKSKAIYTALSRCQTLDSLVIQTQIPLRSYFFRDVPPNDEMRYL